MRLMLISLILLASCSQQPIVESTRSIASQSNCQDMISLYFKYKESEDSKFNKLDHLLRINRVSHKDAHILNDLVIKNFIESSSDQESVKASLVLIKNKYQHFDNEQIIKHFKFLENYCGI